MLLAAAYSICLKPQCGQSTLTLAGDGLATGLLSEDPLSVLRPAGECLHRLFVPDNFRARCRLGRSHPAGDFRFPDEGRSFFDDETRRFQIALQRALRFQFAALTHRDVALHFPENRDRFRFDLAANVRVLTDRQHAIRIDFAFDLAVDEKLLFGI